MAISDLSDIVRVRKMELRGATAICAVGAMIGVLFAGSTVVTPLYVIYKQQFGFSQISLTLIYAAYVLGSMPPMCLEISRHSWCSGDCRIRSAAGGPPS
jgi:hypothetical protein